MLRFIARAIAILAVLAPLTAAAQLPVPPGTNLHNGYIEVINDMHYPEGFNQKADIWLKGPLWHEYHEQLARGNTLVLNRCCILAGSHYTVWVNFQGVLGGLRVDVTPRLCNLHGIPFGYAVIKFSGQVYKVVPREQTLYKAYEANVHGGVVDEGCPSG